LNSTENLRGHPGAVAAQWLELGEEARLVSGEVIEEALITIYLNGLELATIMGTPHQLEALALGFMATEGLIQNMADIDHVRVNPRSCCVDVWTVRYVAMPERRIITSGCGGGITFDDPQSGLDVLAEGLSLDPQILVQQFSLLQSPDSLYARSRGVHSAGISDGGTLLAMAEDVGRHNTIDKVLGLCLMRGIDTRGRILFTTGRVSSEMLKKAARMGCPLVASRNSPTSLSVAMARDLNITLVGYVRRASMRVYSHPERLLSGSQTRVEDLSASLPG
jgi:FdhD protein